MGYIAKRLIILAMTLLLSTNATFQTINASASTSTREKITPANAYEISQIALLGKGTIEPFYWTEPAWSPDGKSLAVSTAIGIWIYDTSDFRKPPHLLEGHNTLALYDPAFSPDGRYIAAGSGHDFLNWGTDHSLRIWEVANGNLVSTINANTSIMKNGVIKDVAFTPDGKYIISLSTGSYTAGTLQQWEVLTGKRVQSIESPSQFPPAMFASPDRKLIAEITDGASTVPKSIALRDSATLKLVDSIPIDEVADGKNDVLAISGDNKYVAINIKNGAAIGIWDIASNKRVVELSDDAGLSYGLDFSPDGKSLISTTYDGKCRLWDITTKQIRWLTTFEVPLESAQFSPNGQLIAVVKGDHSIVILDATTGSELALLDGFDPSSSAVISPDSKQIAIANRSGIFIIDSTTYELTSMITEQASGISNLVFSHDGKHLAGAATEPRLEVGRAYYDVVRLWDTSTGKLLADDRGHTDSIDQLAFTSDDKRLISASRDGTVRLWDANKGWLLAVRNNLMPLDAFRFLFSPDGRYLATSSPLKLWEITTGKQMPVPEVPVSNIAFSADSQSLITQNDKGLTFWNIQKGTAEKYYQGYFGENLTLNSEATILVGTGSFSDPSIYLTNAATSQTMKMLSGHTINEITSLQFSNDGTFIVSTGDDGTIRIWGIPSDF